MRITSFGLTKIIMGAKNKMEGRNMYDLLKNGFQGLLIAGLLFGGCAEVCSKINGCVRSPENPKLIAMHYREGVNYSEFPGLTYIDRNPTGDLDEVVDYTIDGKMQIRRGTNIMARDYEEFNRLRSNTKEENKAYLPGGTN